MQDYKPRPIFLKRKTPVWVNPLIALVAGIIIGIVLTLNI
jgi:paraquat-inducible protein B